MKVEWKTNNLFLKMYLHLPILWTFSPWPSRASTLCWQPRLFLRIWARKAQVSCPQIAGDWSSRPAAKGIPQFQTWIPNGGHGDLDWRVDEPVAGVLWNCQPCFSSVCFLLLRKKIMRECLFVCKNINDHSLYECQIFTFPSTLGIEKSTS